MRKSTFVLVGLSATIGLVLFGQGCGPGFQVSKLGESVLLSSGNVPQPPPGVQFKFQCSDGNQRGLGESRMRRLTKQELVQTLEDLIGKDIIGNSAIQVQLGLFVSDKLGGSVIDIGDSHSSSHVAAMIDIAYTASEQAFSTPALRARVFVDCAGQASIADGCARAFIRDFGLRAYRRPLREQESAAYFTHFKASGGTEGLKRVFMRLLLSPSLAFHVETGATPSGARLRLTDYEIASRISYRVIGTLPDAALFEAAAKGELQSLDNVKAHVRRLLTSHRSAKARVQDFFNYYLQLEKMPEPLALVAQARNIDANGLRAEMLTELNDFVDNVVWRQEGSFKDLLTSKEVFPRSSRMATILETSIAPAMASSQTNAAHAGLVLRPAILSGGTRRTNPMHRGVFVRKRILCEVLGAPNPNAIDARAKEVGDVSGLPNREGYHLLTSSQSCMGCHATINPAGFALEGYDQLGMTRTQETVFDATGGVAARFPIDTSVDRPLLGPNTPASLKGAEDLVSALAGGDAARSCFARTIFEFQRLRQAASADSCAMREVENASLATGSVLEAFIVSVANEDIFWRKN